MTAAEAVPAAGTGVPVAPTAADRVERDLRRWRPWLRRAAALRRVVNAVQAGVRAAEDRAGGQP